MRHCATLQKCEPTRGTSNFGGHLAGVGNNCTQEQRDNLQLPPSPEKQENSTGKEQQQTTPVITVAAAAPQPPLQPTRKVPAAGSTSLLQVPQVTIQTPTPLTSPAAVARKISFADLYGLLHKKPKLTLKFSSAPNAYTAQISASTPAAETPAPAASAAASSDANTPQTTTMKAAAVGCTCDRRFTFKPKSSFMLAWLGLVSFAFLYNLWTTIAREAFRNIVEGYLLVWLVCDALADLVYVLDIVVQTRTGFYEKARASPMMWQWAVNLC